MGKYFGYVLLVIVILFLVFSNVARRDSKCAEDRDAKFVKIGGKHYPCYDNFKGK